MPQADFESQLQQLVDPMERIIISGVTKKGFHPVAISYAMMIAGMVKMLEVAGKEFTLEMLSDMIGALAATYTRQGRV